VAVVAAAWGVSSAELCGPSRRPSLVAGRQVVIYLARRRLGLSWSEAADLVGRSDHTTAISGYRRIAAVIEVDALVAERLAWITEALASAP
jgi:chromosomal replication initiator protein